MYKKCKVIMLPQDRKEGWNEGDVVKVLREYITTDDELYKVGDIRLTINKDENHNYYWEAPQDLYLVSDDKVECGYCISDGSIFYVDEIAHAGLIRDGKGNTSVLAGSKKIVATSNKELGLPLIPESFIKLFVEKQGKIEDIEVEIRRCLTDISGNGVKTYEDICFTLSHNEENNPIKEDKLFSMTKTKEQLAKSYASKLEESNLEGSWITNSDCEYIKSQEDFIAGYNAGVQATGKLFTLEEARKIFDFGCTHGMRMEFGSESIEEREVIKAFDKFINSLEK